MFAVVSGGQAGTGTDSTYDFSAQPSFLTEGEEGISWGVFTAGSASATHVVIAITPSAGVQVVAEHTSSDCTDENNDGTYLCDVGTVNGGQTVKRFLAFRGTALGTQVFKSFASWDKGNPGGPGGGGINTIPAAGTIDRSVEVVAGGHPNRAGNCTGTVSTPDVSSDDPTKTEITGGVPASAVGCPWGFVGENPAAGRARSEISFFNFPETAAGSPVQLTMTVFNSPVQFKNLKVFFKLAYDFGGNDPFTEASGVVELPQNGCQGPGNTLGANQDACLKLLEKVGGGARATIWSRATGEDPGSGFG